MHLDSPLLQQLYVYWDGKRRGRPYPARQDIDPLELGFILGSLILIEIEHHPLRFRYRLFGSEVARQQGFDMTGKYSEDHPGLILQHGPAVSTKRRCSRGRPKRSAGRA